MSIIPKQNFHLFKQRRSEVVSLIKQNYPDLKKGIILLFAGFENSRSVFRQESSFFYLTGITEPGAILCMYLDGTDVLYIPNYGKVRQKWMSSQVECDQTDAKNKCVDEIKHLGKLCSGYSLNPVFNKDKYENFLTDLNSFLGGIVENDKVSVFTLLDGMSEKYFEQIRLYRILIQIFPVISKITVDLAPIVHYLRRFKSESEIDLICNSVQITEMAHKVACRHINKDKKEYEIQGVVESVFTQMGAASTAFPSIVASGKNTTVLHYSQRNKELSKGELVVLDIGAEFFYYAADLTRTYPVDGRFTQRQKCVYNIVLDCLKYIESITKPGMFLFNKDQPDKSLHHLASDFFDKKGYLKYFFHGIGHFLGLDVHDVGSLSSPLDVGDVFTIEPGIYIRDENIGIRIEDNFLMTSNGAVCLSASLPRSVEQIEKMMQKND